MEKYKDKEEKIVSAVEVETIVSDEGNPEGSSTINSSIVVDHGFMIDQKPQIGGYFVEYEDGVRLFVSPEDFLESFTKVEEESK